MKEPKPIDTTGSKSPEAALEALRRAVQTGLDQIDRGEGIDGDVVFARLRRKAASRKQEAR